MYTLELSLALGRNGGFLVKGPKIPHQVRKVSRPIASRGYCKKRGFLFIIQKIINKLVQKLNKLKLYLIPYPSIQNSSCLCNFFILKFMIENRNFLKIAPFATLPIAQNYGFLLENQWVCGRACFEFPIEVKYG